MNIHHDVRYIIMHHDISDMLEKRNAINEIQRFTCKRSQLLNASRGCARQAKPSKTILLPPGGSGDSKDQFGSVQK